MTVELPKPRGPLSAALLDRVQRPPHDLPAEMPNLLHDQAPPISDEDLQIALFVCYGLHTHGFADVDPWWEWNISLLGIRAFLEARFEAGLLDAAGDIPEISGDEVGAYLLDMAAPSPTGGVSYFMRRSATLEQFREMLQLRSVYNLLEGDQHTLAIPRVFGRAKNALIEIQADEYGQGVPGRAHLELYQITMKELGLDPEYGAYIEQMPAVAIAVLNVMQLFGLHRRWRGALLGNLGVTEIGSSIANRRYSEALTRLGASDRSRWFFDEHVTADAVHEQVAAHDMCGSFCRDNPAETPAVLTGAISTLAVRRAFGQHVLGHWSQGQTALRTSTA